MKKTMVLLAMIACVAGCGGDEKKPAPAEENKTADVSKNPDYQKGLALIGKSDCFTCHKVAEKSQGPAYAEVAKKYAGQPGIEDSLAQKIIKGGSGVWGTVPMIGHPDIPEADAKAMVKYIMLLNQ